MNKNLFRKCVTSFMFVLCAANFAFAQAATLDEGKAGGIATLYALDPLARTYSFADGGREGGAFQENETRNRASDVDFNTYNEDSLTIGIEGGRIGTIIDLGSASELQKRYGYAETVGGGQGFASLRAVNGKMVILKTYRPRLEQELAESAQFFAEPKSGANAPVKLGHVYLVRITDRSDKAFERLVKLLVIAYTPKESVTIRWQIM